MQYHATPLNWAFAGRSLETGGKTWATQEEPPFKRIPRSSRCTVYLPNIGCVIRTSTGDERVLQGKGTSDFLVATYASMRKRYQYMSRSKKVRFLKKYRQQCILQIAPKFPRRRRVDA